MGVGHGARQFFSKKTTPFSFSPFLLFFSHPRRSKPSKRTLTQKLPSLLIERIHLRDRVILVVRL